MVPLLVNVCLPAVPLPHQLPDCERAAQSCRANLQKLAAVYVSADYFERTDIGLKGGASFLAFADQKGFEKVFAPAGLFGAVDLPSQPRPPKKRVLPDGAFEAQFVAPAAHRSDRSRHARRLDRL